MRKILPLTEAEQKDAELHHNWVYSFLHRHNYSIEEFYDVAIMGYLRGIQDYHRKPNAKERYGMSIICERTMLDEMAAHFRCENRQKRKPSGGYVSLDATCDDSKESFINTIITPTLEDDFFEEYDRQHEDERIKVMLEPLTDIQRKIVILKASGKRMAYMVKKLHMSPAQISQELKKIRGEISNGENTNEKLIQRRKTINDITEYIGVPTDVILTLKLSARQLDVVNLLMVGYTESDISRELNISRQAVYDAVRKVRIKASELK